MITPADSPSSPSDYASVPESHFSILAPQADLSAAAAAAVSEVMARQPAAERVMESPQGYPAFSVTPGFTGDWPASVKPGG